MTAPSAVQACAGTAAVAAVASYDNSNRQAQIDKELPEKPAVGRPGRAIVLGSQQDNQRQVVVAYHMKKHETELTLNDQHELVNRRWYRFEQALDQHHTLNQACSTSQKKTPSPLADQLLELAEPRLNRV
jgi:hypothetical protein